MGAPVVVNGWALYVHPQFLAALEERVAAVEAAKRKNPSDYRRSDDAKILAAVRHLIFERIPANPGDKQFRLGGTLGPTHKNWFRAKFFQQYRLFFRYDSRAKAIVYAWLNDAETLRAYGKKTDAYAIFAAKLAIGNPPDDFAALLKSARPITDEA
jgi:toxin YhaV